MLTILIRLLFLKRGWGMRYQVRREQISRNLLSPCSPRCAPSSLTHTHTLRESLSLSRFSLSLLSLQVEFVHPLLDLSLSSSLSA
ncbi:hypothetical protein IE53DRAFT_81241 [Violaceomyces palustris]|uniref:Uncharacterized protein n=1 Tax=Violaceomyces palustris TaxID=1673888 RepID=A0ACD0NY10_9BASI|nr:hypothetical protein IE53DRAFT_81241 [Violaceomyces palustris]